jgi:hypothetical protein
MPKHPIATESPEERELARKRVELADLETLLAQRVLDLATLRARLNAFEGQYLREVGARFVELDAVQAEIAEAMTLFCPEDEAAMRQDTKAKTWAKQSARRASDSPKQMAFQPSEKLKALYRMIAKQVHPDLAADESERIRRTRIMMDVNRAYRAGDEQKLLTILAELNENPNVVIGDGVGAELVRVLRKIAQAKRRLSQIEIEVEELTNGDLYALMTKVDQALARCFDLLQEMAAYLDSQIRAKRIRLAKIHHGSKA